MAIGTIATVASAGLAGLGALRGAKEIRSMGEEDRRRRRKQQGIVDEQISDILSRSEEARERRRPGFEELYGPEVQRATDRIMASVGAGQRGLERSTMARGGDITGTTGVAGGRTLEAGHEALGGYTDRLFGQFRREEEAGRRFDLQRGDRLAQLGTQLAAGERDRAQHRSDQRRQMWMQLGSDVLGAGANIGAAKIGS